MIRAVLFSGLLLAGGVLCATSAEAQGAGTSSWTGPYVGVQMGGVMGSESDNLSSIMNVPVDSYPLGGALGGLYAGYTLQTNGVVVGIEGMATYSGLSGSIDFSTPVPFAGTLKLSSDWQAALKARLGGVVEDTLYYATAGVAVGHGTETLTLTSPFSSVATQSNTHTGWTVGAGIEHAIAPNLSIRAELDYTDFGAMDYGNVFNNFKGDMRASWTQTTATVGLSYNF